MALSIREFRARYTRGIENGLDDIADDFLNESTLIIEREAIDQGTLKNSSEIRKPREGLRIVAWTANHALPVHYGSRPHWPPLAPIVAWVRRNMARVILRGGRRVDVIRPSPRQAERATRSPDAEVLRVAHAIRAKIARDGTAPVPWVPRAWSKVKPRSAKSLQAAIDEALR